MKGKTFKPTDYEVFGGLDVDKRSISVTFTNHQGFIRSLRMPYSVEHLVNHVRKHMIHKMLHAIGHTQGTNKSLMIGEGHRDAPLVDVQSAKHLVIRGLECFAFHRCPSLAQRFSLQPLYRRTLDLARHPSYKSHHERK